MSKKESIFKFIKSLIEKYGEAFPSFPTIAKVVGCSSRHATDLVKQLEEEGRIRKEHRFIEEDGRRRQLSNRYEITDPVAEEVQEEKQASSPYIKAFKSSLNSFNKSLKDDDLKEHYRHREFFEIAKEWGVTEGIAENIFAQIKDYLPRMRSWTALYWSLNRMMECINTISSVGPWFAKTLKERDELLYMSRSRG
jgi:DNA-binding Lrp family transcriptional regulator